MNITMRSGGLRWTLLSFALIGLLVWLSAVLLLRAATPTVSKLMIDLAEVLNTGAATLDESAGAVERGGVLMGGVEPGLDATSDGIGAATGSLRVTRSAIGEVSLLFADLGISLEEAGTALSASPSLREPGRSLTEAGQSMNKVASELGTIQPVLDELIAALGDVQAVVETTADNTRPLVSSLDRMESSLTSTGDALRVTANQIDEVRTSGSLRFALILIFALLGTISISLAVIAGSRLTQLRLVQQVAESAGGIPQAASGAARRARQVGERLERSAQREQQE